jgi:hypothetical protein
MTNKKKFATSFFASLNIEKTAQDKLSNLLDRTVVGDKTIQRTPFMQDESQESILKTFDEWFEPQATNLTKELKDLEQLNRSKFGPRSIQKDWEERKESVYDYFDVKDVKLDLNPVQPNQIGRLRPFSPQNAIKLLKNSTSSGLPFMKKKGLVKDETVSRFSSLLQRLDPCVMFTRTQENDKTRAVWGFPIADTLEEMCYYKPVLEYQRSLPWRAAIVSPDTVDEAITKLINKAQTTKQKLVSMDFSAYDASVTPQLQKYCFAYIKDLFQKSESSRLDRIAERFATIGLLTPDGVLDGPHGVPSGSTFTNEVDSLAQYVIACNNETLVDLETIQIQGDDQASCCKDPQALFEAFEKHGLKVNHEKSYVSDHWVVYLQNLYSADYRNEEGQIRGIYPLYRALGRLVFMERFSDFSEYEIEGKHFFAIRALSILENTRNHPMFEEFVKFVASKDKYGLKLTGESINEYVRFIKDSAGNQEIMKYRYGDDLTGIRGFRSYQVLSESEI